MAFGHYILFCTFKDISYVVMSKNKQMNSMTRTLSLSNGVSSSTTCCTPTKTKG